MSGVRNPNKPIHELVGGAGPYLFILKYDKFLKACQEEAKGNMGPWDDLEKWMATAKHFPISGIKMIHSLIKGVYARGGEDAMKQGLAYAASHEIARITSVTQKHLTKY